MSDEEQPTTDPTTQTAPNGEGSELIVYSRPGCPFCVMLRTGLKLRGVPFREVNIWEDPEAAAFVRSVARGNETVPTISWGEVSMVNPSAKQVAVMVGLGASED